jgi:signal transduction histidine kinase
VIDPKELAEVLDSILEGIQVLGPDWRYLHVNDVAAQHGRSTKQALIGRTIQQCYPGIETTAVFAAMQRCMQDRTAHVMENEFTFPDGSRGHFELRIAPVPQGICVLSIDVTARKEAEAGRRKAEERLLHAQRMEAIGLLASGIAHDFNNLLTVILGQGEIALTRDEGPRTEDVETLVLAARSAAGLTRQLLAYGRRSVQTREVVNLAFVIADLETILQRTLDDRIELVLDTDKPVATVEVDRTQLEQIVMNLVLNARDSIPGRGRITVALDTADFDSDYVLAHPDANLGPHSVLVVSDTGVGMDAATQARIFEPFFTTKVRGSGSGLGLSSVYGIVKQHGGSIVVRSAPGSGSTFLIHLPCATARATPEPERPPRHQPRAKGQPATILVVDDRPEIGQLMQMMLTLDSHRVLLAQSGEQALSLWREHRPAIDLLITDSRMPGMSGSDLIHRVRQDDPELPVLCTSAQTEQDLADGGGLVASVSFLEKPFTRTQLRTIVHQMLGVGDAG